jgi:hypothetical protein
MARFTSSIATALRLITRNGESSSLVRRVDAAPPDAAKPWAPGARSETTYAIKAVWLPMSESNLIFERPPGSAVQMGDMVILVAASGLAVTPDASIDTVKRATTGDRWSIVEVSTLSPNGEVIIHRLIVRK